MIEQVGSNIFRIEIPLPKSPLKATNSYFIRGNERNLLIDTGFNQTECREAMDEARNKLGFQMENTDLFLTHIHSDHTGMAGYLYRPEMTVYAGSHYESYLRDPQTAKTYRNADYRTMVLQSGLDEMGLCPEDSSVHPGYKYASVPVPKIHTIQDGDILHVGDLHLQCIETAGHAPDHFCLYDAQRRVLFSGDHILGTITPNNTLWEEPWTVRNDYLGMYLKNLDKLRSLPIELGLPGHRALILDCHKRIDELKEHHKRRLDLVLKILEDGGRYNAAQVAKQMRWDIRAKSWEDFPPAQKYFAAGEALSHLTHLVFQGIVQKEWKDGKVLYSRIR
ncbi:MAG: MBL fold metallo-hydrolase [Oscillibacter sp.]|nr:MBL fold metallo-hydrolase [Oscillibacter sp.]